MPIMTGAVISLTKQHAWGALKRLGSAVPALFGIVVLTFILLRLLPGDPASLMAPPNAGPEVIAQIRQQLGLDKSLFAQLALYAGQVLQGDLGHSHLTGQPVLADLMQRLPASLELMLVALLLALIIGIPLGVLAALRAGSLLDHCVRLLCALGVAIPAFVTGLLLIYFFYYRLGWVPDPTGRIDIFATPPVSITGFYLIDALLAGDLALFADAARQLLLPAATLALFVLAPLARVTRAAMLAVLNSDFITMARALGISRRRIIVTYALRNALLPVLTVLGPVFSSLLGASVLVEKIFAWPGIASYAADALAASDYAAVQGFVLMVALIYVGLNWLIDVLSGLADPRVAL